MEVAPLVGDVSRTASLAKLVERSGGIFGKLDVFVNAAEYLTGNVIYVDGGWTSA